MKDIFAEVGIEVTKENKKEIDRLLHELADTEYKDCPSAWKAIKQHIKTDPDARARFIERLKTGSQTRQ
jgi:hypothetical protein